MDMPIIKTFWFNNNSYIDIVNVNTSTLERYAKIDSVNLRLMTSSTESSSPKSEHYDGTGAMHFIVATVIVYSIFGVSCLIFNRIRRTNRERTDRDDEEVGRYIKIEGVLKLEGHKSHLLNDMKKYSDDIRRYEEKMRILEIERELEEEKRTAEMIFDEPIAKKGVKKSKRRRHSLFTPKKQPPAFLGPKLSQTDNTLGRMGFSFLFMSNQPTGSDRHLSAVQETIDEETVEEETSFLKTPTCLKHARKTSADARLETIVGSKAIEADSDVIANAPDKSEATGIRLTEKGKLSKFPLSPAEIQSDVANFTCAHDHGMNYTPPAIVIEQTEVFVETEPSNVVKYMDDDL
ncbi:hypothetical protein DPMN_092844 [Dreissena polymorpha]|uniref:Uncharacterized protein n=1 Tax=Dreissena polymorpha TaxID=45954 RepID=A0A9D4L294_DREPO|nr:hypothetical protein DPMN_092844 [Dreissena polymorpha]